MVSARLPHVAAGMLSLALTASVGLAACGGDDVSKEKFTSELIDQGSDAETAKCLVDDLFENLEQDDINKVYAADTEEEAGEKGAKALTEATTRCAEAAGG